MSADDRSSVHPDLDLRSDPAVPETTTLATPADNPAPDSGSAAVRIAGLTIEFTAPDGSVNRVLDSVDLDVPPGQFLAIVGRSGGGKTTVLNAVAGLLKPAAGTVEVLGTTPAGARRRLGFMPARDALLAWRSALRNVEYGLELRGIDRTSRRETARRYLAAVGLADAERKWPWQLSQGMRQRVALARAWALEPELLLMDEPFAALDAQTRESVRGQFIDLLMQGRERTVVLVTHDLEEAVILADRVVVLGDQRILADITLPDSQHDADGMLANPESLEILRSLRRLLK